MFNFIRSLFTRTPDPVKEDFYNDPAPDPNEPEPPAEDQDDVIEVQPIVITDPVHVREIYRLWDAFHVAPKNQDCEARFLMWNYIRDLYPEVGEGTWTLDIQRALTITVSPNPWGEY